VTAAVPTRGRDFVLSTLLVAATLVAYLPAIRGDFLWDDEQYVTGNAAVRAPDGLARIWLRPWSSPQYYPLTLSTFWLEWRLVGPQPLLYHLDNVLLHALDALLLCLLLRRLCVAGAWIAAGLFALHPVHVESVAWITERKNVLSLLFFLLALAAWFRFDPPEGGARGSRRQWTIAFGCFLAALFSKTTTSIFPAVALLVVWWKRGKIKVADVLPLLPFFACSLLAGSLSGWLEKHRVGAWGPDWDRTFLERFLVAGRIAWFYLAKLVWPSSLSFQYETFHVTPPGAFDFAYPLAFAALLIALFALRNRIGRGPAAAAFLFAGAIFPASSFFDVFAMVYSFVADHFVYLASLGPLVFAGAALARAGRRHAAAATLLALVPLAACFALTRQRAAVFAGLESLWRDTIAKNPDAWMARANLASLLHVLAERGNVALEDRLRLLDEAERNYRQSLATRPQNVNARVNLARLLDLEGRSDEAEREYRAATDAPNDFPPGSRGYLQRGDPWFHYARFLEAHGRLEEAQAAQRRAVEINPSFDLAFAALGRLLANDGRMDEAAPYLERAIAIQPTFATALLNLGAVRGAQGRLDESIDLFRRALESDPSLALAHANLGRALARSGDRVGAATALRRALELDPSLATARTDLDEVLQARP